MPPFGSLRHRLDDASAAYSAETDGAAGPRPSASRIAAIGPEHLRAHPAASRAGQERDHVGNVFRPAEALERGKPAELLDLCLGLALQKELRRHRAGGHGALSEGQD